MRETDLKCVHILACGRVHTNFLIIVTSPKRVISADVNARFQFFSYFIHFKKLRIIIRTELVFPVSEPATTKILVRGGR